MKLLQILYPGLGGHSSVAFSLIESDREQAFKHSLMGFGIEEPSDTFVAKAKELNVEFSSVKKEQGLDFASQKKVYQLLKKQKPEYLIVHSTSLVFVVFIYSLFHKVKWLMVEHQSNHAKTKMDWIYSFFILLLSPKIVYLTENYRKEINEKFKWLVNKNKIQIIPNGINTDKFYPAEQKSHNKEMAFSMISRLTPLRDHKTLIEAVAEVAKIFPCKLYIAGDGDTKPELETLVNELNLDKIVHFTGTLNEEEVIELLNKTDIYIHSSLAETLSTSLLQVMACKVPIIATDIDGINNLLVDGADALLFEAENKVDLINCILTLIKSEELKNKIVDNCSKKINLKFSSIIMLKKYKTLLHDNE